MSESLEETGGRSGCAHRFRKRRRERSVAGNAIFHVVCIDLGSRQQSTHAMPTADAWETLSTTVEVAGDAMAASVYCAVCNVRLNGPAQYADHRKGRMHRKNERGRASIPSCTASTADHLVLGRAAHICMLEVTSQAELAALGAAARRIQRAWHGHRAALS